MFFSVPKFDLFLFYLMERSASAIYNISQANWVVFGWLFKYILEKNHFLNCSIFFYLVGTCDICLENT